MVTVIMVALALWFGFELGRHWSDGRLEIEVEKHDRTHNRGKIRLNTMHIRR
jgi:hypothetical protein